MANTWGQVSTNIRNDYRYDVAIGRVPNQVVWNKFGFNADVDTGAEEVIAAFGGTFTPMTTADTLDIVSDSASDVVASAGASTLLLTGIDENADAQTEIVSLNGTTPVTTANQWLGINRVVVLASGSSDYNVGNITVTDTGGSFGTQASLPAAGGVTQQCIFHTPRSYTFMADWLVLNVLKLSGGGVPRITVKGYSYSRVTDTRYEVFRYSIDTNVQNDIQLTPSQPFVIGGREVLYFTATTSVNNTEVNMRFSGLLLPST